MKLLGRYTTIGSPYVPSNNSSYTCASSYAYELRNPGHFAPTNKQFTGSFRRNNKHPEETDQSSDTQQDNKCKEVNSTRDQTTSKSISSSCTTKEKSPIHTKKNDDCRVNIVLFGGIIYVLLTEKCCIKIHMLNITHLDIKRSYKFKSFNKL